MMYQIQIVHEGEWRTDGGDWANKRNALRLAADLAKRWPGCVRVVKTELVKEFKGIAVRREDAT